MPDLAAGILETIGDFTLFVGIGLIFLGFLFFFLARIIFWLTLGTGVLLAFAVALLLNAFVEPLFHIPELCYAGIIVGIIIASLIYAVMAEAMAILNGILSIGAGYSIIFGFNFALRGGMALTTCMTLWIIATIVTSIILYLIAASIPSTPIALLKKGIDLKDRAPREKVPREKIRREREAPFRERVEEPMYYHCTKCGQRHRYTSRIGKEHEAWEAGKPPRADEWVCPGCGKRVALRVALSHLADKHRTKGTVRCLNCNIELPDFVSMCPLCEGRTRLDEAVKPSEPEIVPEEIVEEPVEALFCIKCGAKLDFDSRFCVKCGTRVEEE